MTEQNNASKRQLAYMFSSTPLARRAFLQGGISLGVLLGTTGLHQGFLQEAEAAMSEAMTMDWNPAVEASIQAALSMVPEVGAILGGLVQIFWPYAGENIWAEIEQQVEQLIHQELDRLVSEQIQANLQGLQGNLGYFLAALKFEKENPAYVSVNWNIVRGDFEQQLPSFQLPGYELLLLPLFAQFVNLHLALLRDGVLFGSSWGWTPDLVDQIAAMLTSRISAYTIYAQGIYQQGYQNIVNATAADDHNCQPFRSVNAYVRQMTLSVLDFLQLWPYFDVTTYPNPVQSYLNREIYSDPVGTCDNSGAINLPGAPTQPISQVAVWSWDRIDHVQVTYPDGGGPGGMTQTDHGDLGGSNAYPHGGVFKVDTNPITIAAGLAGDILNAFTFTFKDGRDSGRLGGNYPGGELFTFSYPGEIVSSIHINGVSQYYGSADSVVFGFQYERTPAVNLDVLRRLYISSVSDATQVTTRPGVELEALPPSATKGWDAQRQAFWDDIKAKYLKR